MEEPALRKPDSHEATRFRALYFILFLFSFASFASFVVQLFVFGRMADLGRKALMMFSLVSMYGPPMRSMQ